MSPGADPQRIDAARAAATRNRLIGDGTTEATADAWIAAWHNRTARAGLKRSAAYWEAAWTWITAEQVKRVRP